MTLRALFLLLATIAFGVAPFVTAPFTGYDPSQFPVQITDPAVQPAGYAFSIWSIIYLWLIAHAAFGFWRRAHSDDWDQVRVALMVSLVIGAVWLAIAARFPLVATFGILLMWATALAAFVQADEFTDRWMLSAPLAIYAGWLSAAAAVSTGVVLAGYGLLGDTTSALAMVAIVLVLAGAVQWVRPQMPVYGITVVWALIGIVVANVQSNLLVALAAVAAAAAMAAITAYAWYRRPAAL